MPGYLLEFAVAGVRATTYRPTAERDFEMLSNVPAVVSDHIGEETESSVSGMATMRHCWRKARVLHGLGCRRQVRVQWRAIAACGL